MATFTHTTTTEQDAALAVIIEEVNAQRAAQDPPLPPLTAQEYAEARINDLMERYVFQIKKKEAMSVEKAYLEAPEDDKVAVRTRLGIAGR